VPGDPGILCRALGVEVTAEMYRAHAQKKAS
jgi:hypothetical protein